MSSSEIAVAVRGLGKSYTIAHQAADAPNTLAEAMLARLRHPLRRSPKETFWALRDVDFDIKVGEVVGIIGRNGAGKSTLLKILSRITEPTHGEIELNGRVGSLLEVGTGFHPELTGRENVFLNGAILGMGKAEIRRQFDAIVDFAGVEQFLDTPVKRYSSGMYVRLAFAVAAHLNSDILIVDEVLAVGDAEFQKKCLGKMGEVANGGRTVIVVSHNMATIASLCSYGILLRSGQVISAGRIDEAISEHLTSGSDNGGIAFDPTPSDPDAILKIRALGMTDAHGSVRSEVDSSKPAYVKVDYEVLRPGRGYTLAVQVQSVQYGSLFTSSYFDIDAPERKSELWAAGRYSMRFPLPIEIMRGGDYVLEVAATIPGVQILDQFRNGVHFRVIDTNSPVARSGEGRAGIIMPVIEWTRSEGFGLQAVGT